MSGWSKVIMGLVIAAASVPIWGTLLWEIWDSVVRPRRIARNEIDAMATSMLARHGDQADEMARIEEDRAWRYSDGFEQGVWRRVRTSIQTMREERDQISPLPAENTTRSSANTDIKCNG